jgi:hypothetical protein
MAQVVALLAAAVTGAVAVVGVEVDADVKFVGVELDVVGSGASLT